MPRSGSRVRAPSPAPESRKNPPTPDQGTPIGARGRSESRGSVVPSGVMDVKNLDRLRGRFPALPVGYRTASQTRVQSRPTASLRWRRRCSHDLLRCEACPSNGHPEKSKRSHRILRCNDATQNCLKRHRKEKISSQSICVRAAARRALLSRPRCDSIFASDLSADPGSSLETYKTNNTRSHLAALGSN